MVTSSQILVVEDNHVTRKMIRVTLLSEGYRVLEAPTGSRAIEIAASSDLDLVLQDLLLPDMEGGEVACQLRAMAALADVPILALSGFAARLEDSRALAAGFDDWLLKPIQPTLLLQAVGAHLRARLAKRARGRVDVGLGRMVLAVDDDPAQLRLVRVRLELLGYLVTTADCGRAALDAAARRIPDAVVSDVLMPGMNGFELCRAFREDPRFRNVPVLLHSALLADRADVDLAAAVGASAFVPRTPDLVGMIDALAQALERGAPPPPSRLRPEEDLALANRQAKRLEALAAMNVQTARRCALQAAQLAVLSGVSDTLTQLQQPGSSIGDVLALCLDAGGISRGALYLRRADGQLELQAQSGYGAGDVEALRDFYGCEAILYRVLNGDGAVAIPNEKSGEEHRAVLERSGLVSFLLTPVVSRSELLGVLAVASRLPDLLEEDFEPFVRIVAAQIGQGLALSRAFQRLAASEERYRSLMENASDAVFVTDLDGQILESNQRAELLLGRQRGELSGSHLAEWLAAESGGEGELGAFAIEQREQVCRVVRRDAAEIWVEASTTRVPVNGSDVLLSILRNVTERRRADRRLHESNELLRALVQAAPVGIALLDGDGLVRLWNPAGERIFGISERAAVGRPLGIVPADRSGEFERLFARVQSGEIVAEAETIRMRADGARVAVLESGAPVLDPQGRSIGVILVLVDVSEQKRAEDALQKSQEQFIHAQRMEAIGRLAGGVAHDFNNLLTAIAGFGEILRGELGLDNARCAHVDEILAAADRAAALTRHLLAFSRRQVLSPRVLDLNGIVRGLESLLRRLIGEDIRLTVRLDPGLCPVRADPGQLEQVIMNLVVNARDAMPEGGNLVIGSEPVQLAAGDLQQKLEISPGKYALMHVSDDGVGMSAQVLEHLFEPFFTTKEPGKGTGLGLSTVYGIVRQSGGAVAVESELATGTEFSIYLPCVDAEVVRQPEAAVEKQPARGQGRIVVVEDEPVLLRLVGDVLARNGYSVTTFGSGTAALEVLAAGAEIDLLITDVVMPEIGGPELATRIQECCRNARILYMSGYAEDLRLHQEGRPPADFIPKPFTPSILLAKVREILERQ